MQIIWGGRDADQYYDDLWAFDLETFMWEEWMPQTPAVPNGRNHLGGFHANGVVYIYGMSSCTMQSVYKPDRLFAMHIMHALHVLAKEAVVKLPELIPLL